jgi:hypothetical protein
MRPGWFASRRDQTSIDSIDPSSAANIRWLEARAINLFPVRFWGNLCAADGTRQRLNETDFHQRYLGSVVFKILSALISAPRPTVDRHGLRHPPQETFQDDAKTKPRQHIGEPMGQQDDARADKQRASCPNQISDFGRQ